MLHQTLIKHTWMKNPIPWVVLFAFMLMGCADSHKTEQPVSYLENTPSFFALRHGDWTTNRWIRDPENLLTIHETFCKIGYINLIPEELLEGDVFLLEGLYIQKNGQHLLDSLEWSYHRHDVEDPYYSSFWKRREAEGNDSIVHIIIRDINEALRHRDEPETCHRTAQEKWVNDTLFELLQIEYRNAPITEETGLLNFEVLRRLGFHQSAYHLLYEYDQYMDLNWNRDSLAAALTPHSEFIYPWFPDLSN